MDRGLEGLIVVSFESRRATEMAELIRRHGGIPVVAPSMREVPLTENAAALDFVAQLDAGAIDVVILLTGVGTRALVEVIAPQCPATRLAELLGRVTVVARGPKPVAALRELGLAPDLTAPEPNTWREVLGVLDASASLRGKTVALQEYGVTNPELIAGLEARGARVRRVPVYRWALPEDVEPLRAAVRRVAQRNCSIALFTSATQVDHVMRTAADLHLEAEVRAAASQIVVASIGPVCDEALRRHQLPVDVEPAHPKMGQLVAAIAQRGRAVLAAKKEQGAH
jgi:uroporphyrinogen-III synthase